MNDVNPARKVIRLRPAADGSLERLLPGEAAWAPTGISGATVLNGETMETLDALLTTFIQTRIEDLEWDLRLSRQRSIGRRLYRELFGAPGIGDPGQWLHFAPEISRSADPADEAVHNAFLDLVCRIPWAFLTRADTDNASFLMLDRNEPVAITFDAAPGRGNSKWFEEIKFPLYPRVLLVIPQVEDPQRPTFGREHQEEIDTALRTLTDKAPGNIQHVTTFADYSAKLVSHLPHVVYFYGHGFTGGFGARFQFQKDDGAEDWRSFDEIGQELNTLLNSTQFPPVVWINACLGAAAHQESALRTLAPLSSCVIATRTLAAVDDSRPLARHALPLIVIHGRAPHSALRQVLRESPPSVRCARWATTIIAVQYGIWSASSPESRSDFEEIDLDSVGDFPRLLDRKAALTDVTAYLATKLAEPRAAPGAILWHGEPDQGLNVFEQRVTELMQDHFPDRVVHSRYVELQADAAPSGVEARERHFRAGVFCGLSQIRRHGDDQSEVRSDRIKRLIQNLFGGRTLLALLHGPLFAHNDGLIKDYIAFWGDHFDSFVGPGHDLRVVLGFGFFDAKAPNLQLERVLMLGSVPPRELEEHMWSFRAFYSFPSKPDRVSAIAHEYVDKYSGRFEPIRRRLEEHAGFRQQHR